jgi:hypothetical protein
VQIGQSSLVSFASVAGSGALRQSAVTFRQAGWPPE